MTSNVVDGAAGSRSSSSNVGSSMVDASTIYHSDNGGSVCKSMVSDSGDDFNTDSAYCNSSGFNKDMDDSNCNNSDHGVCDSEDDINSMRLCSNCMNDFDMKNEESFENDACGHILCIKCRFVQDGVCRLCKIRQQEELNSSVALDLTTGYSSSSDGLISYNGNNLNKPFGKKTKRIKYFVVPSYINVLSRDPPEYQCSICKRKFHYKLQSKYHEACFTGQRPLKCDLCDKTFIKKSHLEYHLRMHSGAKLFTCSICDKGFVQKGRLLRHIKIHSAERPFKCEICNEGFCTKQRLESHIRKHTKERPFHCRFCRWKCKDKLILSRHELKHFGVKNFVCEICGKRFVLQWNLILHQRRHGDIKPFCCDYKGCTSRFLCHNDLIRHAQTHSSAEYDYECSICTTAFRRKDNLERHMKNAHPESVTALGKRRQIVTVVKIKDLPSETDYTEVKKIILQKNSHTDKDDNKSTNILSKENSSLQTVSSKQELRDNFVGIKNTLNNVSEIKNKVSNNKLQDNSVSVAKQNKSSHKESNNCSQSALIIEENERISSNTNEKHNRSIENNKENLNSYLKNLSGSFSCEEIDEMVVLEKENEALDRETGPNCQKVSVISHSKKYLNNEQKLTKNRKRRSSGDSISKKPVSLAPYRLITPPVKPPNAEGGNCVPTITKVTHIIHTNDTGVPNIQTVITTRDVTEKTKIDKPKQKNSVTNVNKEIREQNINSGVIKYAPKSSKNSTETKHKCYRVLGQNSTGSSNSSNTMMDPSKKKNNVVNSFPVIQEPLNNDSLFSESALSVRNIPLDNNNYVGGDSDCSNLFNNSNSTFYGDIPKNCNFNLENNFLNNYVNDDNDKIYLNLKNNLCNGTENAFNQLYITDKIDCIQTSSVVFNSNSNNQLCGDISQSCLLADNSLDESLTASLCIENENNNSSNNVGDYNTVQVDNINVKEFISSDYKNVTSQVYLNNINLVNSKNLQNISSAIESEIYNYSCDETRENSRSFNEAADNIIFCESNEEHLLENDIQKSSEPYVYNDHAIFPPLKNLELDNCSVNVSQNFVSGHSDLSLIVKERSNDCESNGLFTLANMACERASVPNLP